MQWGKQRGVGAEVARIGEETCTKTEGLMWNFVLPSGDQLDLWVGRWVQKILNPWMLERVRPPLPEPWGKEWVRWGPQHGAMGRKGILSPQSNVMVLDRNERCRKSARTLILLPGPYPGGKGEMCESAFYRALELQHWGKLSALRKLSSSVKNKGMKEDKLQRLGRLEKDGDEQQLRESCGSC